MEDVKCLTLANNNNSDKDTPISLVSFFSILHLIIDVTLLSEIHIAQSNQKNKIK